MSKPLVAAIVGIYSALLAYLALAGETRALHSLVTLNGWWDRDAGGWALVPGLLAIGALQAWMIWALLRMPPLTVHRGLRQALIALALTYTVLFPLLPELLLLLLGLFLIMTVVIFLPAVFADWPLNVRNTLVALGLAGVLLSPPLGMVVVVWWGAVLLLQFLDGRWSTPTLVAGLLAMGTTLLGLIVPVPPWFLADGPHWATYEVLLDATAVTDALWLVLTARELTTLSPWEPVVTPHRSRSLEPRPAARAAA
ncbi:hypothetical protein [Herbidospora sp. RD11066]